MSVMMDDIGTVEHLVLCDSLILQVQYYNESIRLSNFGEAGGTLTTQALLPLPLSNYFVLLFFILLIRKNIKSLIVIITPASSHPKSLRSNQRPGRLYRLP